MSFEIREKPAKIERALLVALGMPGESKRERTALLAELVDLVGNLGIGIAGQRLEYTREIQAKYLCGIGKAEEIRACAEELQADCVIFDNMLSPSQQREWEKLLDVPVMDREEVILDIFEKRARTREAVMQVDLARMQYALPRMTGMWKHLDRQRGGSGGGKGGGAAARGEGKSRLRSIAALPTTASSLSAANWRWCAASAARSARNATAKAFPLPPLWGIQMPASLLCSIC